VLQLTAAVATTRGELRLSRIKEDPHWDPTNRARRQGAVMPPSLRDDYAPISLPELLEEDLRIAQLTIEPSYYCNLSCRFCALPTDSKIHLDWDRIRPVIQLLRLGGLRWAVLAGGEPGISPRIGEILSDVASLGIRTTMLTHGMWAANRTYAKRLVDAGLCEVNMSIKSVDNDRFKALCGAGSFDRQMQGLSALSDLVGTKRFDRLLVNHVVTCHSPDEMESLFAQLRGKNITKLILTFMEPYEDGAIRLSPDPEAMARLGDMLETLVARAGFPVDIEGFPLCHLNVAGATAAPPVSWRRDDVRLNQRIPKITISPKADADHLSVHYGYQRYLQYVKAPGCAGCSMASACPGIHQLLQAHLSPRPIRPS